MFECRLEYPVSLVSHAASRVADLVSIYHFLPFVHVFVTFNHFFYPVTGSCLLKVRFEFLFTERQVNDPMKSFKVCFHHFGC